jgi:hypothetical protein
VIRNYVTNNPRSIPCGVCVYGHGSHIHLLRNDIHSIEQLYQGPKGGNGHGIGVYGTDAAIPISDILVSGNKVHDLRTGSSESVTLSGNITHFLVSR